eukprot:SAG22_NODE_56_length_23716_cov_11.146759_3_plen_348_part_00
MQSVRPPRVPERPLDRVPGSSRTAREGAVLARKTLSVKAWQKGSCAFVVRTARRSPRGPPLGSSSRPSPGRPGRTRAPASRHRLTAGWLVGWLVGLLVGRSVGRSVGWSVGWSVVWLVETDRQTDRQAGRQTDTGLSVRTGRNGRGAGQENTRVNRRGNRCRTESPPMWKSKYQSLTSVPVEVPLASAVANGAIAAGLKPEPPMAKERLNCRQAGLSVRTSAGSQGKAPEKLPRGEQKGVGFSRNRPSKYEDKDSLLAARTGSLSFLAFCCIAPDSETTSLSRVPSSACSFPICLHATARRRGNGGGGGGGGGGSGGETDCSACLERLRFTAACCTHHAVRSMMCAA